MCIRTHSLSLTHLINYNQKSVSCKRIKWISYFICWKLVGQIADSWFSLKGLNSGILESSVGAHSLNILSRLESLSGGPSGGGYNCWQLRPHGNMGMAVPSHHPGHLTWDQGCIWYFGRWEVHRSSPNHSQTRSFIRKSQNTSLLVIDLEHRSTLAWPSLCCWGNPFSRAFLGMRPNIDSIPISFRLILVNVLWFSSFGPEFSTFTLKVACDL